ncbi:MAG: NUDIX domain-containing protein [Clostridia bacterium]|nr:NUDIX domain-containing protein [Clostridia bacterium]
MDERHIRTSAKALVIRNGRMLAIRLRDADGEFFIMPGGGQQAGELLPDAVRREVLEETGVRVAVGDLAFVIEGAHGESFHRVDLVFRCDYEGEGEASHPDTNQTGVAWLDIATLNTAPLYPSKLRRAIMDLHEGKPHPAYLGNEEAGDPACTA